MSGTTRERILDATAAVLRGSGAHRATTKEIAAAAGCSEALLYKHFVSKAELFAAVLAERLPLDPAHRPGTPTPSAGRGDVRNNLCALALAALAHYETNLRALAAFHADPALLERLGPQDAAADGTCTATGYLRAEQSLGRISGAADPDALAALLLGACLREAFLAPFAPGQARPEERAARIVDALLPALLTEQRTFSST
ncbi:MULTISPECIES: TetR/AcrR family transcriptional regulator [unclassified Streptomyces]|uniref:TetR/AcrR family transcriptional regulator n=1 Tax=unclassified Streptomyces TaxID=2593676 RepID=UPI002E194F94|nr:MULTISPECIES: helix-turn-helix domain-containing protein [unclassified Streptomyces]